MPYLSSLERFGIQRGERQGQAKLLTRQMHKRYGQVPDWVQEKINNADSDTLSLWGERLMDADAVEAVFQ